MTPPGTDIGAVLRGARKQRGLSIADIAQATKIAPHALVALERGEFERLPGGLYRKAYLRAFAEAVGLDAAALAAAYAAAVEREQRSAVEVPQPAGTHRHAVRWIAVAALVLFALVFGVLSVWRGPEPALTTAEERTFVPDEP